MSEQTASQPTTTPPQADGEPRKLSAREINEMTRYTMWSVFCRTEIVDPALAQPALDAIAAAGGEGKDLVVRGFYDVAGLRADADLMIWWHAPPAYETLQAAYHAFRATELGQTLVPVWSQLAAHRPAEFNKSHVPAFMADEQVRDHLCVYPFVRSHEWYLLPDPERRALLAEHGMLARGYPRRAGEHDAGVRPGRLRVDPRLRGRRDGPHPGSDAYAARLGDPAPRPDRDAVLLRTPARARRDPDPVAGRGDRSLTA